MSSSPRASMAPGDCFVYGSKRARLDVQRSTASSSDDKELGQSTSLVDLPADLLARVAGWTRAHYDKSLRSLQGVAYAAHSAPRTAAVLALGTTCKRLRSACEPFIFDKLTLETAQAIVQAVKELRGLSTTKKSPTSPGMRNGPLKHVKELSIKLETVFPLSPTRPRLFASLCTLIAPQLTSLEVHIGPDYTVQPFASICPNEEGRKALSALPNLARLQLGNIGIWLHELAEMMHGWENLKALHVDLIRGDCTRTSTVLGIVLKCRLRSLRIKTSSMTNETTAWLLKGQSELEELALPVQGFDERILASLEKVMASLKTLDLRDMWADHKRTATPRKPDLGKSKDAASADDERFTVVDEGIELPPVFRMLKANSCPDALHLNPTILPNAMCTPEGISAITASMLEVETLSFDAFPSSSSVCSAFASAIRDDELPFLQHVEVSGRTGGGKTKASTQGKGFKELQSACKARNIAWTLASE